MTGAIECDHVVNEGDYQVFPLTQSLVEQHTKQENLVSAPTFRPKAGLLVRKKLTALSVYPLKEY